MSLLWSPYVGKGFSAHIPSTVEHFIVTSVRAPLGGGERPLGGGRFELERSSSWTLTGTGRYLAQRRGCI